jgi:hypothetical protein
MDAAAAVGALALLAAAAGLGAAGCGAAAGEGPAAPGGAPARGLTATITSGEPAQIHSRVAAALSDAGQPCRAASDRVICTGDGERSASFYVVYRAYPARLLFGSPWRLTGSCGDAAAALNRFNWDYDELSASCDERGTVIVQGAYFVPEGGLSARDVVSYARWWTLAEVRALQASPVAPLLQ